MPRGRPKIVVAPIVPVRIETRKIEVFESATIITDGENVEITYKVMPQACLCPSCHKKQFEPINTTGSVIRKCDRCHKIVTYKFEVIMPITVSL